MIIGYCSLSIFAFLPLYLFAFPLFTELNTSSSVANFSLGSYWYSSILNRIDKPSKEVSLPSILSLGFAFKRAHCLVETLQVRIWPCTGISYQWFSTLTEKTKQEGLGEHTPLMLWKNMRNQVLSFTPLSSHFPSLSKVSILTDSYTNLISRACFGFFSCHSDFPAFPLTLTCPDMSAVC